MEPESDDRRVPGMQRTTSAPAVDVGAASGRPWEPPGAGLPRLEAPAAGLPRLERPGAGLPRRAPAPARRRRVPGTPAPVQPEPAAELAVVRSFDDFYRDSRTSIGRALALALGDADLAGDATDEAMVRAYERWATVSRLQRPEAWVYRVGLNWSLSFLRRRRRSPHRLYEPATVDGPVVRDPAVHEALGALDVKHRAVVVCRHLLGWSVAETALALGVRDGTVKSRLHRAHRILRTRLGHLRDIEEES